MPAVSAAAKIESSTTPESVVEERSMPGNAEFDQSQNPYASPMSEPMAFAAVPSEDPERAELRAFVGSRANYYLSRWSPLLGGRQAGAGFNWAAFLFSGLWIPYRKMYKVTLIFYAVVLLESILEEVVMVGILGQPEVPGGLSLVIGLAIWLICGVFGNRWYFSHAKRVIAEARAEGFEGEALLRTLSRRGGTNLLASFGIFFLFLN